MTNDAGQFRIGGLTPGKYRVRAVPQQPPLPPEIRTDGTAEVHYAATYYPESTSEQVAARVLVGPASEATGIDIRMVRTPIIRLAGKVSGLPDGAKDAYVQIAPPRGQITYGAQMRPDGSFEVWRLEPGKYTVWADLSNAGVQWVSGSVEVEVGDSDVENIGLRLLPPEEIHGPVEFR